MDFIVLCGFFFFTTGFVILLILEIRERIKYGKSIFDFDKNIKLGD